MRRSSIRTATPLSRAARGHRAATTGRAPAPRPAGVRPRPAAARRTSAWAIPRAATADRLQDRDTHVSEALCLERLVDDDVRPPDAAARAAAWDRDPAGCARVETRQRSAPKQRRARGSDSSPAGARDQPCDRSTAADARGRQNQAVALARRRQVVLGDPAGQVQQRSADQRRLVEDSRGRASALVLDPAPADLGDDADQAT